MSPIVLGVALLVAVGGSVIGLRHLYLKLDRPGGFECSLRVSKGEVAGLTHRFRAGYAGRELDTFVWRRIAWPSPAVRFPATTVRMDHERAPSVRDHLLSVPAHFAVFPVELTDDVTLDLAFARRKVSRIINAIGDS